MSKYWSEAVRKTEPYTPGEQPRDRKYIKLNTNENPYPPSPGVIDAIRKAADDALRLYPDPDCNDLRAVVAAKFGLNKKQVYIGNGSDELLAFAFMAFFDPGRPILFPDITYTFYPVYCKLYNIDYRLIALDEEFDIPAGMLNTPNGGIIIANPNAPTGKYLPVDNIRDIVEHNTDSVVIIDEAYIDYGGESAVSLIKDYPNLLVMRTLSKGCSLAGLRVGYALGHEDLIEGINRIKNSFNSYTLDRLALAGALAALEDDGYYDSIRLMVMNTRERVSTELKKYGFKVIDSKANFIFISHPLVFAESLFIQLRERSILVRYFRQPAIKNYLRVSIGSDKEMDCFLEAVRDITAKSI